MNEHPVEVNELLQVRVMSDKDSLTYPSRVNDLVAGDIVIAWPTNRGVRVPIREKQQLWISFVRQDAAYAFAGVVEERQQSPLPQLRIRPSGDADRIQRRQYFRVRTGIAVDVTGTRPDASPERTDNVIHVRTHTFDLSGSGISIRVPDSIPEGMTVELRLTLPNELPAIKIVAQVVHTELLPGPPDEKPVHHIGIYFLAISEHDRSRIIRYVFRVQQMIACA